MNSNMRRSFFRGFIAAAAVFVLVCVLSAAGRAAKSLTADQVLDKMFETFRKENIKSMVYDEVRTVATKSQRGQTKGIMPLDSQNATTYVMRYYYRAPDKHGYRMLSDRIDGFWPGHPSEENNIAIDERWTEKVHESYNLTLSPSKKFNNRDCYVLNLTPKPGVTHVFPMTWYVDQKKFIILKFFHLVKKSDKRAVSTNGEITYDTVNKRLVPVKAKWVTTMTGLPYDFTYTVRYKNYLFNVPLDDSVFVPEPKPVEK